MTRFWITLEGVELVFKAIKESKGGETYISRIPLSKLQIWLKLFSQIAY